MLFFSSFLQTSTDILEESSHATDYDDADYVPEAYGNSSDTSSCSKELKTTENNLHHKLSENMSPGNITVQWG